MKVLSFFSLERISNVVTKVAHLAVVCTSITSRVKVALSSKSRRSLSRIKRALFLSSRSSLNGSLNGGSSRKAEKEEAEEKSLTLFFPREGNGIFSKRR